MTTDLIFWTQIASIVAEEIERLNVDEAERKRLLGQALEDANREAQERIAQAWAEAQRELQMRIAAWHLEAQKRDMDWARSRARSLRPPDRASG